VTIVIPDARPQVHVLEPDFEPIPDAVLKALDRVRMTRLIDMYDRETVMLLAAHLGYGEAMEWLVDHRHLYFVALRELRPER
jgi:hypothetical protein